MSQNDNQQQQIQEPKPTTKQNSYTYWVDDKNKSRQLPLEQRPKKVQVSSIIQNKPAQNGRSHWNTAGTWQLKGVSLKQIQSEYQHNILQWIQKNSFDISIKKVSINGQCEVVFIRNKKVLTYQINGKVEFQKIQKENQLKLSQNQSKNNINQLKSQTNQQAESSSQQGIKKGKQSKQNKKKTLTFEIIDFSDSGDRQYKCKADENNGKIFITQKAQQLIKIFQNIINRFK